MLKKFYVLIVVVIFAFIVIVGSLNANNCGCCSEENELDYYDTLYVTMTDLPPEPDMSKRTMAMNTLKNEVGDGDLPSYFNWKDHEGGDWTSPVKNQGACGSCWAFAAAAMIEAKLNIIHDAPNMDIDLSEQYILSCLPLAGSCSGGWTYNALDLILDDSYYGNYVNGIITETCMVYHANDSVPCSAKCLDWEDHIYKLEDFGIYHFADSQEGKDALKQALIEKGPLGVSFYASPQFKAWGGTHHSPDDYYPYEYMTYANHAVILVGYKDDPSIPHGGYWILKNSWGTSFGYGGFFNLEYGSLNVDNNALWVDVPPALIVDFDYNPKSVTNQDVISFMGISNKEVASWWWDFDDGYYSDLEEPIHRYYGNGIYNVTLTVTTTTGLLGSVSKIIEVPTGLVTADFDYDPENPTTQNIIQFVDQSIGGSIDSWEWDFDDGTYAYVQNPTHQYSDDGMYDVALTITGGAFTDSITKEILVSNVKPVADFAYTKDNNEVTFIDLSYDADGYIVSYEWDFDDGDFSTLQNPVHLYSYRGSYIVSLNVIDDNGAGDQISYVVDMDVGPNALYSYSPLDPETDEIIQFTDESVDAIAWSWDFGDGGTSSVQNPTHQYIIPGSYNVTLEVFDFRGIGDMITKTLIVSPPNIPPQASFIYNPVQPGISDEINFIDASADDDGIIVSWYWDFGDGNTSTEPNPTNIYWAAGDYTATLTVTDDDGDSNTFSQIITVLPNNPPTASFEYNPLDPTTADIILFTDTSVDNDGIIVSWYWDFGDLNISSEQNPQHRFSESGTYAVVLTVMDNDGDVNYYALDVFVNESFEHLDVEQTKKNYPYTKIYYPYVGAQSFKPQVSTITKIELLLYRYAKNNRLSGELTLYLKNSLEGDIIASETIANEEIPKTWEWIEFDIPDTDIVPDDTYYILLTSSSNSDSEYIYWLKGKYTGYNDGAYYLSDNCGRTWRYFYSYDFCFKIYGV